MSIGGLDNIEPGQNFESRRELYDLGIHRALQAGIVGRGSEGAESIVLSGGYVDDEDHGDVIIYTGEGGRDPNSGRQVADQEFTRGNLALVTSSLQGLPVRVIRGSRHKSPHSPSEGYRYDGLFSVESYWTDAGEDGHRICRFRLVALEEINPVLVQSEEEPSGEPTPARRTETMVQRIVRDTALGIKVKELHDYTCQVCGVRLECVGGPYAEAAHIRPLGAPHNGPDELSNLLCLCPNHHVLFDRGGFTVDDDLVAQPMGAPLKAAKGHTIAIRHLGYHRSIWT
jgi:putative restriction endonuclease